MPTRPTASGQSTSSLSSLPALPPESPSLQLSPGVHLPSGTGHQSGFKVAIDQIGADGKPSTDAGFDRRVILTNQEQAILAYVKRVTDPRCLG